MKKVTISILDFAILIIYIVLATYFLQKALILHHCGQVDGVMIKDICVPKNKLSVCLIGDSYGIPPYPVPNISYDQWQNLTGIN